jgi:hypothetical protein
MAQDSTAILVAGSGKLFVAPLGTTLPTDLSTALNAAFIDTGFVSKEGMTLSFAKTKEPVNVWQQFEAVRYVVQESSAQISGVLRQWDQHTIPLAFGGGAITEPTTGIFKYTPAAPEEIDERAIVLEWLVGASKFRLKAPRAQVTEGVETTLARSAPSDLPINLGLIASPGVATFEILSDHASWDISP